VSNPEFLRDFLACACDRNSKPGKNSPKLAGATMQRADFGQKIPRGINGKTAAATTGQLASIPE
jgi:hypothetical protein